MTAPLVRCVAFFPAPSQGCCRAPAYQEVTVSLHCTDVRNCSGIISLTLLPYCYLHGTKYESPKVSKPHAVTVWETLPHRTPSLSRTDSVIRFEGPALPLPGCVRKGASPCLFFQLKKECIDARCLPWGRGEKSCAHQGPASEDAPDRKQQTTAHQ